MKIQWSLFMTPMKKPNKPLKKLQKSGFDMKQLSIAGMDCHTDEAVVGYYDLGD